MLHVLDDVSIKLPDGAIVAILGPNGSGKTTILKIIAGLLEPDSGAVTRSGSGACHVGYLPATNPVFGWRRVIDDIGLALESDCPTSAHSRHESIREFIKEIGFSLPLNRRSYALSTGQKQMVNICRALIRNYNRPSMIAFDEGWSALDATARGNFQDYISSRLRAADRQIILTSHQVDQAVMLADYVLPVSSTPVCLGPDDLIPVPFQRPRTALLRASSEFRDFVNLIEDRCGFWRS